MQKPNAINALTITADVVVGSSLLLVAARWNGDSCCGIGSVGRGDVLQMMMIMIIRLADGNVD